MQEPADTIDNGQQEQSAAPAEPAFLCPVCQSEISEDAVFCAYCGKQIKRSGVGLRRWAGFLMVIVLVTGGLWIYIRNQQPTSPPEEARAGKPVEPVKEQLPERQAAPVADEPAALADARPLLRVTVGLVVLSDIAGNELARIPAAVMAGGWLALPKRACMGGYDWQLQVAGTPPIPIEDGIVAEEDSVGLWRLQNDPKPDATKLVAWRPDRPLSWISLTGDGEPEPVTVVASETGSHFARVRLDTDVFDFGLLVQDETVVGWTFGELADGAYLWIGADASGRVADLRIDDFYRIHFANSREEEFLRALALGSQYTDLERIELLAGAFRLESRLDQKYLMPELQPDAIIEQLRALISTNADAGLEAEVAALFDAEILSRAADAALTEDVVRATAAAYGYGNAVVLLESTIELMPVIAPGKLESLRQVQSDLYRRWLQGMVASGDFLAAAEAFDDARQQLPDDLGVHLLGVRLYLAQNDWSEAERLLAMKNYPPELSDTVAGLRARIQELKAQAGSIVIRFTPGSRQIPVTATVGVGIPQQFIIDTGASMVTIPSDTARELGLIVNVRTPRRTIYTAGGVITAPEVVVPSIAIDEWEVRNVKALVVDLPNELGWGLLGMNYLRRFRMDLNTDEGLLLLEPR